MSPEELTAKVSSWLGPLGDDDTSALRLVAPAVVAFVASSRARLTVDGKWTDTTELGAVMLAARLVRRRNSPAGIEAFTADATVYVRRTDPDVARLLRLDAPAIG